MNSKVGDVHRKVPSDSDCKMRYMRQIRNVESERDRLQRANEDLTKERDELRMKLELKNKGDLLQVRRAANEAVFQAERINVHLQNKTS